MRSAKAEIRRQMAFAVLTIVVFGGAATAWSLAAPLDSAVVASGAVVAEGNLRKVQHQVGGTIGTIYVTEDQHVDAGQLLVRLEDTETKANLNIVLNELTAARVKKARLDAERDGSSDLTLPDDLRAGAKNDANLLAEIASERALLASRRQTREGQRQQLKERVNQLRQEIDGTQQELGSAQRTRGVAAGEKANLEALAAVHLVPTNRMTQLERELDQADGTIGGEVAKIAELKDKISETELQEQQLDKDFFADVDKDLRETETKIGELEQRKTSAEDLLRRVEIKAPISGTVHQLAVHTVGGVVTPSEPLMLIVPDSDRLIVEVKIAPQDIDQVSVGEDVRLRFTAFNRRTTPELKGRLFRLSGDLNRDPQTGAVFYLAGIAMDEVELAKLEGSKLIPGMPSEAYILTGTRTFASYILKPIRDQMERAARER